MIDKYVVHFALKYSYLRDFSYEENYFNSINIIFPR